jgi:hypothetical protein
MIHNLCHKRRRMTELRREVRDQGVLIMKWTSSVIITIIFFFEELFSKIKERLYNFYIIQADYSSQPLSKRGVSTVKPLFSKTPKFTLDISSLTDDNDSSLANANTATFYSIITGPAASSSRDNVPKRSAAPSLHDNIPKRSAASSSRDNDSKRGSKSKSERSRGNCKFLEKSANSMV